MTNIGVVIIGRNEGERLIRCIQSLQNYVPNSIYVDSASSDGSLETASMLGTRAIALDMTLPFTAARARNTGAEALFKRHPEIEFIQFVDGDCEVLDGWPNAGIAFLKANQHIAIVSGVLYERFPNKTIYNTLCDLEWKMSLGEVKACGGNALVRVSAFKAANGFLATLIAGEEPELCVRLRQQGWKVWHIDVPMMLHDANMISFNQWWKRTTRAGYAFAEGAYLHGAAPEFHWVAESKRAWIWGFFIPFAIILLCFIKPMLAFLLLLIYPIQILRLALKSKLSIKIAFLQAIFLTIGKFAEVLGQMKFLSHRFHNKISQLIEYK